MKILVVGSGGREHALCRALAASPACDTLSCAPGNAGIAALAQCHPVAAEDVEGLTALAQDLKAELVVVGPEAPLVAGLVDRLKAVGIMAFGPDQAAAALEGSKAFMKDLCARHGIPTAPYARFQDADAAKDHIRRIGAPLVVKADGLAAGKGVVVAMTEEEALQAVDAMMVEGQFGAAGTELVLEAFLEGEEVSYFALIDGEAVLPLASAQDHKRAHDGDTGPNTGGMGAYSPAPVLTPALEKHVLDTIIRPLARAMVAEGRPYRGVLFAGLMLTADGPQLLEINIRFGDPECQALMARLQSDLVALIQSCCTGALAGAGAGAETGGEAVPDIQWDARPALCVVMAAKGYPGAYEKGTEIRGLPAAEALPDVRIDHAGTRQEGTRLLAVGGRVLGVTALGDSVAEAQKKAYQAVEAIDWPEGFCRRDIGWRAV